MRLALALVGVVLASSAGAGPRAGKGKVVRVERRPSGLSGTPRYCALSADLLGYCVSAKAPEIGDRLHVLDHQRVLGVVRVTAVQQIGDACQEPMVWMTQGELESGNLTAPQGSMLGVIDVPLDTRNAKLVTVDRSPGGRPWGVDTIWAIDGDGDGGVDLQFAQFQCDDTGSPSFLATSTCYEVWATMPGRGQERIRTERLRNCY